MDNATYEIWDVETANIVGFFATEDEALGTVGALLKSFGRAYADELTLSRRDGDGPSRIVATGDRLAEMAERRMADRVAAG